MGNLTDAVLTHHRPSGTCAAMVPHPVPGKLGRERPRGASAHEQEQVPQLQLARGEVPEVALASKLLLGAKVTPETKRAVLQIIDDIEYDIALGHRHVRV